MVHRRLVFGGHYLLQDFTPPLQHFSPPETFRGIWRPTKCYPTRDLRVNGTQFTEGERRTALTGLDASGVGTISVVNLSRLLSQETDRLRA